MIIKGAFFELKHLPYYNYQCHAPVMAAVGTSINVFSYDAVLGRYLNPSPSRQRADTQRYALRNNRRLLLLLQRIKYVT